jgi:autotransporter-associated beta strand protein
MTKRVAIRNVWTIIAFLAVLARTVAQATDQYWSANASTQGGTGTWDLLNPHWGSVAGGPFGTTWDNTANANDTAVFGGTAGTVTLGTDINVGGVTFGTASYVVTSNTLTLASGAVLNSTVGTDSTTTPKILSVLAGNNGFTKTGSGWLEINAASSSLSGDVKIEKGTLYAAHAALGTGGIVFTGDSTFSKRYSTDNSFPLTMSVTVNPGVSATISGSSFYYNLNCAGALVGDETSSFTFAMGGNTERQFNNTNNTFLGEVYCNGGGTADNGGRCVFKSLPDSSQKIRINNSVFRLASGGVDMTFANRPVEILADARIDNDSTSSSVEITIAQDLIATIGNNNRTLILSGVNTGANTFAGVITNSATGSGVVSVTKDETGKWILSGKNTYTGVTRVNAGTLVLEGEESIKDTGTLNIVGGKVEVKTKEKIAVLQTNSVAVVSGTYGSNSSKADNKNDTYFTGTGVLYVGVDYPPSGTVIQFK